MNDNKKCPYCKLNFPKSYLSDHINHDHGKELRASLKRLRIALPIIVISLSIVIGMIYGVLLK